MKQRLIDANTLHYATFCAMTPRYNSDGTLYCDKED